MAGQASIGDYFNVKFPNLIGAETVLEENNCLLRLGAQAFMNIVK